MAVQYLRIQVRRDSEANWAAANPILLVGEVGFETDTKRSKTGNGISPWSGLAYDKAGIVTVGEGLSVEATTGALELDNVYKPLEQLGDLSGQSVKEYVDAQDTVGTNYTDTEVASEKADRESGDAGLQAELNIIRGDKNVVGSFAYADEAEYVARTNADNTLDGKITTNTAAILAEKVRAEAAEALLTTQVGGAQTDATNAGIAAAAAQATGNTAVSDAAAAKSVADNALVDAATADGKAVAAQTDADSNTSNISTLDGRVTANESGIATNVTNIATNATDIATNATDIASIDADKYDKSEVDTLLATKLALSGGTLTGTLAGTEGTFSVGVQGTVVRGGSLTDLSGQQVVDCVNRTFTGKADSAVLADAATVASDAVTSSALDTRITAVEGLATGAVAPSQDAITLTTLDANSTGAEVAAAINNLTLELAAILNS